MLTALASLGSMAMSGLGSVGGWLGTAGGWIGSNLSGIGSALGGLGGLAGSLFGATKSTDSARKTARLQYEYQKKAWMEGPSLQRRGLEDAGYNPMLALNGNSASFMPSANYAPMPDIGGSVKALASVGKDILGMVDAQKDNIEADTKLKEGQLSAVESQRLLAEANASLLQSQTERSDLAYGRDIADTVLGIAGTGASLYSAKAMSDVARQNARTNSRNATVNERRANQTTFEVERDANGNKVKEIQRSTRASGVPTVSSSANPKTKATAHGALGSSAKRVGSIAKEVAQELLLLAPVAAGAYGVGKLQESADRRMKSDKRSNYGKGYKHFVPRLGL